jgi:MraZ protein
VAARFFGRYEHSLDVKGRLILPSRYRAQFGPQAYLSQYQDRCLALWTPEEFEKQMAEMERLQDQGRTQRNLARIMASGSTDVEIDRQGRLAIPSYLRSFARLESGVLVIGALNRVELWNPAEWESRVLPAEAELTSESDDDSPSAAAVSDASAMPEP